MSEMYEPDPLGTKKKIELTDTEELGRVLYRKVENALNEAANKMIEEQTMKFKNELIYQKSVAISEIMRTIEIEISQGSQMQMGAVNLLIAMTPNLNGGRY